MIDAFTWATDDNLAKSAEQERHERYQRAMANLPEAERGENPVIPPTATMFYPDRDIVDVLADGRCFIVCAAGMPMPIQEARGRGLVVDAPVVNVVEPGFAEFSEVVKNPTPVAETTDKRTAVLTALAQHPEWSDREIARQTGASNTYVGRLRKGGA